jgi:hypothetical protein
MVEERAGRAAAERAEVSGLSRPLSGLLFAAALPDEIQVYTEDPEKPGEHGVELRINATPKGRTTPDFRHILYLTTDTERVNFGIGYGLTSASDRWTIKTIISF